MGSSSFLTRQFFKWANMHPLFNSVCVTFWLFYETAVIAMVTIIVCGGAFADNMLYPEKALPMPKQCFIYVLCVAVGCLVSIPLVSTAYRNIKRESEERNQSKKEDAS